MKYGRVLFEASLAACVGAVVLGSTLAFSAARFGGPENEYKFIDPVLDVKSLISERYVEAPDEKALRDGAIKGMVEALNDPYTIYVPASERTEFTKELTGEYVGIGAQVQIVDQWLTIVSPLEDSPAFKAGILPGDRVKSIAGKSTFGVTVDECIDLLTGEPGTPVDIIVERAGKELPITIVRDRIKTKSVKGVHRESSDPNKWDFSIDPQRHVAYLRLTQFTPNCAEEIYAALQTVGADKGELKGLVLDLRSNPGGLLQEAIEIADMFLEDGVIVSTRGRAHKEQVARAQKEGTLPNFPIAILVNGASASASEVLSGALVENNRAIVVGTRSFGKGSVQTVIPLERGNGAELKMTEQGYYLPSGRSITRKDDSSQWGVDPTDGFYVPVTDQEFIDMLKARREEEILRAGGAATGAAAAEPAQWENPDWVLSHLKDKQLAAAVRAVQAKIDTGEWKPTGEKGDSQKQIAAGELNRIREARERLTRELIRIQKRVDALEGVTTNPAPGPRDFWADDLDLTGGHLDVFDKDGKKIATLKITGNNLERWLLDADVDKEDAAAISGPQSAAPAKADRPAEVHAASRPPEPVK